MGADEDPHKAADRSHDEPKDPKRDRYTERGRCRYPNQPQEEDHADLAHAPTSDRYRYHGDEK